jgi:4-aminobutyrate aminotransferase
LHRICKENGIILIDDEVQTGFARTGKMWACEHWNLEPEVLCISKAMAGGLPCGACVTRSEIMDWTPSSHENTLGGNPIVIAAALAVMRVIRKERLVENAAKLGAYLIKQLKEMQDAHKTIGEVRGKGMMIGIELVKDKKTKTPATEQRNDLILEAFKRGVLLLGAGQSSLRLAPPLVITQQQIDSGLEIFETALNAVEK